MYTNIRISEMSTSYYRLACYFKFSPAAACICQHRFYLEDFCSTVKSRAWVALVRKAADDAKYHSLFQILLRKK
jgi:hypothetical protein